MQFAHDLEATAHRSANGEHAWPRAEALRAVRAIAEAGLAVLGGEVWLVRGDEIWGVLPQQSGPPAVYHWEAKRGAVEPWLEFVTRSQSEACSAIKLLPPEGEVDAPSDAHVYYNMTWASEREWNALSAV